MSTFTAKQFDGTMQSAARLTTWMDALGHDGWTIQQFPKEGDVVLLVRAGGRGMVECKEGQYLLHLDDQHTWHVVTVPSDQYVMPSPQFSGNLPSAEGTP